MKFRSFQLILILFIISQFHVSAQEKGINRNKYRIHINQTNEKISIDGILEEEVWATAERARNFQRVLPIDTGYAHAASEAMLTYDEGGVYMGIICHDTLPGRRPVQSLRRDWSFQVNDNFIVFIDTYNDYTNGFAFGVSAAGAQWDGIHGEGGFVQLEWDTKWKSAVKNYPDRWEAEFYIPFRSIRYKSGVAEWGINFSRLDLKASEKSSWAPMPRQFPTANLAFTGSLMWDRPLPTSGIRFSLIPYISGKVSQDKEVDRETNWDGSAGLDAKVILSTSMNLDLTLNPDFSQVEVDRQVTNLDRFELFFPEKRQFFLENSDIFASLGAVNMRPFFSRRIGLDSPVLGGARLSGKITEKWRIGLMDMQTGLKDSITANNYGVAAIQRQLFSRSNITAFMVNKQVVITPDDTAVSSNDEYSYNRVAGLDFNLATADNKWTGKFFYHQSFYPGMKGSSAALSGSLVYNTQTFRASLSQAMVGADYEAEVGYIRRKGIYQSNATVAYKFYPVSQRIANHGPQGGAEFFLDPDFELTDREVQIGYGVEWLNRSRFSTDIEFGYVKLLWPFDPTNTGGEKIPAGSEFSTVEFSAQYISDSRRLLTYDLSVRYGGFYNGTRLSLEGEAAYRVQPYGSLALATEFNRISLPEPYNSIDLILIGPRLDITFTEKLFLTTFVQYNKQIDNLNVNMRFQWRFAPVSDLYIVYTENAYPGNFRTKNRGLVVKLSYWFN
ncbi:MAG: hypothetical protein AMS27_16470 [Bacteroides sp. SM23_62_1]|nr:MAG: hypothetical protein AMS27_16470 [Bacteroides sp. SM23_62_1]